MKTYSIIGTIAFLSIQPVGCGEGQSVEVAPAATSVSQDSSSDVSEKPASEAADSPADADPSLSSCGYCYNCVYHARCLTSGKLPYGLDTWAAKLAIAKSRKPYKGCVAVMDTRVRSSDPGHVAYVTWASADGLTITVDEANYPANVCRVWTGSAASRKVVGYWCP